MVMLDDVGSPGFVEVDGSAPVDVAGKVAAAMMSQ